MARRALPLLLLLPACGRLLAYDDLTVDPGPIAEASTDAPALDGATDTGPTSVRPPPRPAAPPTPSGAGKTLWFAARDYSYGGTNKSGAIDVDAWRTFGYDLDGVCTLERDSTENVGTCLRPPGAKQDSLVDGEGCRDNNLGRIVSNLLTALPGAEQTLNDLVRSGSTTWILRIDDVDLGDDGYAPGALYRSSDDRTTSPPAWDGTDDRAVQSDSLVDGDLGRPVLVFPKGYVSGGVWSSGDPAALDVIAPLTAIGFFPLPLQHAFVTARLDATRTKASAGLLVGVLPRARVLDTFDPIADFLRVCPGTGLYAETLGRFQAAPDVVIGAPGLQDQSRTCDGVSSAIAFELTPIKPVTRVVPPIPPRKPRCGDAG